MNEQDRQSKRRQRRQTAGTRRRLFGTALVVGALLLGGWAVQQGPKQAPPEVLHEICIGGQMNYPILVRWDTRTGVVESKMLRASTSWRTSEGYSGPTSAATARAELDQEGNGVMRTYHGHGLKASEVAVSNNQFEGRYVEWSETGAILVEGTYLAGLRHGTWTTRHAKAPQFIEATGSYDKGKMSGKWEHWHRNGQKHLEAEYSETGLPTGKWRAWYEHGQLLSVGSYKDGKMDGPWEFWKADGTANEESSGIYVEGKRIE